MSIWLAQARLSWRRARLVLAGTLLLVPAIVGGESAATVNAATAGKWTSCPGVAFYPVFADTYDPTSVYGTNPTHGRFGRGVFTCPLQLPPGATIIAVEFNLYDGHPSADIGPCHLNRVKLNPPDGTVQSLAGPRFTTGTPGFVTRSDTSIAHATVGNRSHAYYASCSLPTLTSDNAILGVSVKYLR